MKVEAYEIEGEQHIKIAWGQSARILEVQEARDLWAQLGGALWLADGEPDVDTTPTRVLCQKIFERADEMSEIARRQYQAREDGNLTELKRLEQADLTRLLQIEKLAVRLANRVYQESEVES